MISVKTYGNFDKTFRMLKLALSRSYLTRLESYGQRGVAALSANTPKDSGETAHSWSYKIIRTANSVSIIWLNDAQDGALDTPLAILIQYGHGTRNGGYVEGRDYINPTMRPMFDSIAEEAWRYLNK